MRRGRLSGLLLLSPITGGGGGGGGGGGSVPTPIPDEPSFTLHPVAGGGSCEWRETTDDEIGDAFVGTIAFKGKRNGAASATLTALRRGDAVTELQTVQTFAPGSATAGVVSLSRTGDVGPGDSACSTPTLAAPFLLSSVATGTEQRDGDGTGTPTLTALLTYANATSGSKQVSASLPWYLDVFDGLVADTVTTGDIDEAMIEALATASLQGTRTLTTTRSPANQRWLRCIPDLAQYTTGTVTFLDENNAAFLMQTYVVVAVTNDATPPRLPVTVNYRCYLSSFPLTSTNRQCRGT